MREYGYTLAMFISSSDTVVIHTIFCHSAVKQFYTVLISPGILHGRYWLDWIISENSIILGKIEGKRRKQEARLPWLQQQWVQHCKNYKTKLGSDSSWEKWMWSPRIVTGLMAPDQCNVAVRRKNVPVIGRQEEKESKSGQ